VNQHQCVFIKPENHGCGTLLQLLAHGVDYVNTRPVLAGMKKAANGMKKERKEHVQKTHVAQFKEMASALGIPTKSQKMCSREGISSMIAALKTATADLAPENPLSSSVKNFKQVVGEDIWGTGYHGISESEAGWDVRVGREVYVPAPVVAFIIKRLSDSIAENDRGIQHLLSQGPACTDVLQLPALFGFDEIRVQSPSAMDEIESAVTDEDVWRLSCTAAVAAVGKEPDNKIDFPCSSTPGLISTVMSTHSST